MKTTLKYNNPDREVTFDINFDNGSEKQIDWALNIIVSKLTGPMDMAMQFTGEKFDKAFDQAMMICNKMLSVKSAKFWIDNRNNNWKSIYQLIS